MSEDKKSQQGPPYPKKPKLSKAERRALQEQQRAAKAAKKGIPITQLSQNKKTTPTNPKEQERVVEPPPNVSKSTSQKRETSKNQKEVELFSHLPQYRKASSTVLQAEHLENIHPEIVKLGLKYADWSISGSNARCVALLTAFCVVIKDYKTPPDKSLDRHLESHLSPLIQFLANCRPKSISMGNAIRFVKAAIHKTGQMSEEEAKKYLLNEIDNFIQERVVAADELIVEKGKTKIVDGDVVLTYACSTSVERILCSAYDDMKKMNKKFRVVIVDSRPTLEGKGLLHRLSRYGLECCYVMFNALSFIMTEVSKVFLGAHAMLSNGNLLSRVGTSAVAMMANRFNIPVMVCCETYKFVERAQLDAICFNELGDPDQLATSEVLKDWRNVPNLKVLNLTLDITPVEFVTMVITEVGMIPPTSVPVILREQSTIDA